MISINIVYSSRSPVKQPWWVFLTDEFWLCAIWMIGKMPKQIKIHFNCPLIVCRPILEYSWVCPHICALCQISPPIQIYRYRLPVNSLDQLVSYVINSSCSGYNGCQLLHLVLGNAVAMLETQQNWFPFEGLENYFRVLTQMGLGQVRSLLEWVWQYSNVSGNIAGFLSSWIAMLVGGDRTLRVFVFTSEIIISSDRLFTVLHQSSSYELPFTLGTPGHPSPD